MAMTTRDRILALLSSGPMRRKNIGGAIGRYDYLSHKSTRNEIDTELRRLQNEGIVCREEGRCFHSRGVMWRLAKQP